MNIVLSFASLSLISFRIPYLIYRRPQTHPFQGRVLISTSTAMGLSTSQEWISIYPGNTNVPPYEVYQKALIRSQQDTRDYRIIRLRNGLEATLIHDLTSDQAAASLTVSVGHLNDPVSRPQS